MVCVCAYAAQTYAWRRHNRAGSVGMLSASRRAKGQTLPIAQPVSFIAQVPGKGSNGHEEEYIINVNVLPSLGPDMNKASLLRRWSVVLSQSVSRSHALSSRWNASGPMPSETCTGRRGPSLLICRPQLSARTARMRGVRGNGSVDGYSVAGAHGSSIFMLKNVWSTCLAPRALCGSRRSCANLEAMPVMVLRCP